jgi:hypothetical protein
MWVFTVCSASTSVEAIPWFDRPRATSSRTSVSRGVSPLRRTERARRGAAGRLAKSAMRRRVTEGARSASPTATTRTAEIRSAGGAVLEKEGGKTWARSGRSWRGRCSRSCCWRDCPRTTPKRRRTVKRWAWASSRRRASAAHYRGHRAGVDCPVVGVPGNQAPLAFVFADTTEAKVANTVKVLEEAGRRYWAPRRYDTYHRGITARDYGQAVPVLVTTLEQLQELTAALDNPDGDAPWLYRRQVTPVGR